MGDVIDHPKAEFAKGREWVSPDGATLLLAAAPGALLTAKDAIYMLEDVKLQILMMMRCDNA